MRWTDFAQGVAAIASTVFGFGLLAVAFLQWRVYRRQAGIMETQVALTASQALMVKQTQRAFVFIKELHVMLNRKPGTLSAYGTLVPGTIETWQLSPVWENSGDTPARRALVNFNCKIIPHRLPDDFDFADAAAPEPILIGPKASVEAQGALLAGNEIDALANSSRRMYVWGWIDYDDVFEETPRHRTEFCFEVNVFGSPPERQISFPLYKRYNGADQECLRAPAPYVQPK